MYYIMYYVLTYMGTPITGDLPDFDGRLKYVRLGLVEIFFGWLCQVRLGVSDQAQPKIF